MNVTLLTISKQCSDIINTTPLHLPLNQPVICDLRDIIYDLYPNVDAEEYNLYFRYSHDLFCRITDYLSYVTVLTLMADKTLYLVLNDCDDHCEQKEAFLRKLDAAELKEKLERERDIYDVKIKRPGEDEEAEEGTEEDYEGDETGPAVPRTDTQIITYAIRKLPETKCFTTDLTYKSNLIGALKKGWTKLKNKLTPLNEEVIERAVEKKASKKDSKGKGSKSDKSSKKK